MSCVYCNGFAQVQEKFSNLEFCGQACQKDFYSLVGDGFFDQNPNYIQSRDVFWLLVGGNVTLLRPVIMATALGQANPDTRSRVLTWLMDKTAPIQRLINQSRDTYLFNLFRGAGLINNDELMKELNKSIPIEEEKKQILLKELIKKNKAKTAAFLMGPIRDYNTELVDACFNRHLDMVKLLLKEGLANPAYHRSACLRHAVNVENPEIVRELLIDNRAQINENVIQEAFVDSPNRDIIGMILDHQGSSKDMIRSILERVKDARLKAWIKDRGDL